MSIAVTAMLAALWAAVHHSQIVAKDGEIYAFQALARINPAFHKDIYLAYGSQDAYTIFSPLYALVIHAWGLENAALVLLVAAKLLFFASAWHVVRRIADRESAWLAVAMLIITVGAYGAFDVFEYLEGYFSARSVAEALVVCALACALGRARIAALVVIAFAMAIHPIMTLPGLLLLLCLWVPARVAVGGAVAGVAGAAIWSLAPMLSKSVAAHVSLMDPAWLEVVRERSQFLFLQLWPLDSWDKQGRAFLCLGVTALALPDPRVRRLCRAALLVGGSGLAVAAIAGTLGPVPILLQGQAWRWFWVTSLVAVLLLPMTVRRIWGDPTCGPLCALLLLSSWTFAESGRTACVLLALALWCLRGRLSVQFAGMLRWAAIAWGIMIAGWILANTWTFSRFGFDLRQEAFSLQKLRNVLALQAPAVVLFWGALHCLARARGSRVPLGVAIVFTTMAALILPTSLNLTHRPKPGSRDQYADWQRAIPVDANVYLADGADSPRFAWFELGRPSYLSLDQSAGVVFSRGTALEIERRSTNLLPLLGVPEWRVLTRNRGGHRESQAGTPAASDIDFLHATMRPLTPALLREICGDPALGFLIAREDLGFGAVIHRGSGKFKDWSLYDCQRVRGADRAS